MNKALEEFYFDWLYAKVMTPEPSHRPYFTLLHTMFKTEFVWILSGDDNRAEDGLELRNEFNYELNLCMDKPWFENGCSILEMLIAFSRRANFQTDIDPSDWFWEFVANLDLTEAYDDAFYSESVITKKLYDFVWRTYKYDGTGGLFPLNNPEEDQRKVEVWYQFCAYISEKDLF